MCDFVIVVAAIAVVAATAAVWLPSSMVVVVVVIHKTIHHFDLITYTCIYFVLYVLSSRVLICSFFAPPYVCVFVHASCAHKHIRTVLCHVYVAPVRTRIPIFFLITNWIFRWSKHFIPNCAKKAECWCFVEECFFLFLSEMKRMEFLWRSISIEIDRCVDALRIWRAKKSANGMNTERTLRENENIRILHLKHIGKFVERFANYQIEFLWRFQLRLPFCFHPFVFKRAPHLHFAQYILLAPINLPPPPSVCSSFRPSVLPSFLFLITLLAGCLLTCLVCYWCCMRMCKCVCVSLLLFRSRLM